MALLKDVAETGCSVTPPCAPPCGRANPWEWTCRRPKDAWQGHCCIGRDPARSQQSSWLDR